MEKKKRARGLRILLGLLMIAMIAFAAAGCGSDEPEELAAVVPSVDPPARQAGGGSVVLTEENFDDVMAGLEEDERFNHFMMEMNVIWTFENSSEPSMDAHVANSGANLVPMFFEVELEETGEIVYTSPIMPVGSRLDNMIMDAALPEGHHSAIVTFILLDEDYVERSQVSVGVTLVMLADPA